MSFIAIKNIWQEYGDHVVLERINLEVREGSSVQWSGPPAAGNRPFASIAGPGEADPGRHHP